MNTVVEFFVVAATLAVLVAMAASGAIAASAPRSLVEVRVRSREAARVPTRSRPRR